MKLLIKLVLAGMVGMAPGAAAAHEYNSGNLVIGHPWVRVTIPGRPAAGYLKVQNLGGQTDRILSASTAMAERIEIHTVTMKDGIMRMRRVEQVEVPANGHVELKPGGLHFMIFGLKPAVKKGDKIPLSVVFEKAGTVEMEAAVAGMGDMKMDMDRGSHSGPGAVTQ